MINNNIIEKILEYKYQKNMPISNLIVAVKFVWYINKSNPILEKILEIQSINLDLPLVFKEFDNIREQYKNNQNSLKKKGTGFDSDSLSLIYLSLYKAVNLKVNTIEDFIDNERVIKITKVILKFHYSYLKYKNEHKKEGIKLRKSILELSVRTLIRTIEYLVKFEQYDNAYINEKYFDNIRNKDIDINFLELASTDPIEKDYFLIKQDKNKANFLVYENYVMGIKIHIESSRTINKGQQTGNFEQNHKIADYFATGLEAYLKLLEVNIKKDKKANSHCNFTRERGELQYTEEEELLNNSYIVTGSTDLTLKIEDVHTVKSKLKVKTRALPTGELEDGIPNLHKQKLRNKAFSANITKKSMLLSTDYKIPPMNVYKDFLKYFFDKQLPDDMKLEDAYKIIFFIDCITGMGYKTIIELMLEKKGIARLENNTVAIMLNKKLFAKDKNKYIANNNGNKILYKLPENLIILINRAKSYYRELDEETLDLQLSEKEVDKYFKYIKEKIKSYPKRISFDPKSMWRIIDSYRKSLYYEDMSTLFCVGRNQQNDTPKLAYASTNKRAQNHSKFLEQLYIDLGLHELSAHLLGLKQELFKPKIEFNNLTSYVGSSQAVNPNESKLFFSKLRSIINLTTDEKKYFNLVAIYIRYALSLLVGTRPYKRSASIDQCSIELHVLSISEKAETLLSGLRIIPLCPEIEKLIVKYKEMCKIEGINSDNIYLKYNNQIKLFETKIAIEILNIYKLDNTIIDFLKYVPLNTGRHVATKIAMEQNFNIHYLEAYLGHYIAGGEHQGIYSLLDMPDYISKTRILTSTIAKIYGVLPL